MGYQQEKRSKGCHRYTNLEHYKRRHVRILTSSKNLFLFIFQKESLGKIIF